MNTMYLADLRNLIMSTNNQKRNTQMNVSTWTKTASILVIVSALTTGCATNWNSRVGIYSFSQVVQDMGAPPTTQRTLPNGDVEAKWQGPKRYLHGVGRGGVTVDWTEASYDLFLFDAENILKSHSRGHERVGGPSLTE